VLRERQMLCMRTLQSGGSTMGTWGHGPFDNDAAVDWYMELIETSDLSLIEELLHTDIIERELFFTDMDLIQAACEVVLGLLAPDDFEQRSNAGPKHVDPLEDGLGAFRDLKDRSSVNFSIPSQLVDWVKQHRHLDAKPLLASADTILNHVKARGNAFYDGYLLKEETKDAWLSYIHDLHRRLRNAIQA
jgi:Domain of unknown function (DUF4259)